MFSSRFSHIGRTVIACGLSAALALGGLAACGTEEPLVVETPEASDAAAAVVDPIDDY